MRNSFKIILLAAVMMLCFSPPGAYSEEAGGDGGLMDGLLEAVGILNMKDADADASVTRAEAVYYALLTSGVEADALSGPGNTIFDDVPPEHKYSAAVQRAYEAGYISEGQNYLPDAAVTYIQAVKIFTEALGYRPVAVAKGGYPYGYLSVANDIKLTGGVTMPNDGELTYKSLRGLIYNALRAVPMRVTGILKSDYVYSADSSDTLLSLVFDIYKGGGILTQTGESSLSYGAGGAPNRVKIYNDGYTVTPGVYESLSGYLGWHIDFYYTEIDGDRTVISFSTSKNTVRKLFIEDIISFDGASVTYSPDDGQSVKTVKIRQSATVLYNGAPISEPLDTDFYDGLWGDMLFIDAGNSGKEDLISVKAYENYVVSAVDAKNYVVYDASGQGGRLDLSDGGKLKDGAVIKNKGGVRLDFGAIVIGAVLSVAESRDKKSAEVVVVTEKVSGTVEEITSDRVKKVFVDGNEYKVAPNADSARNPKIELGGNYVFGLDMGGRIASIEKDAGFGGGYVFLIDAAEKKGIDGTVQLRAVSAASKVIVLKCADRVEIDGEMKKTSSEILGALSNGSYVTSRPVEIKVTDGGLVNYIDTPYAGVYEDINNSLRLIYPTPKTTASTVIYKQNPKTFASFVAVAPGTKIFLHPEDKAEKGADELYKCRDLTWLVNDKSYPVYAYAKSYDAAVAEIVSIEGSDSGAIDDTAMLFVVDKISGEINDDGDSVTVMSGLYNGAAAKYELLSRNVLEVKPGGEDGPAVTVAKGDAVRFARNDEGKVSGITLYYDCSERKAYTSAADMDAHKAEQLVSEKIYRNKNGFLSIFYNYTGNPDTDDKRVFTGTGYRYCVVEGNKTTPTVRPGSITDIKDFYTYGEDCSTLLLQTRYYEHRVMVIYNCVE